MSLNKNSVYCVLPRSSKPPNTCKWGGPKLRGILKFSLKSNFKIKVTCLRLKLLLCEWMSDHTGALGMSVRKKIVCTYICMKSPVSLTLSSPNNLSLKILRFSTKLRAVHTAQLLICILIQHVQKKTWKAVARAKQEKAVARAKPKKLVS